MSISQAKNRLVAAAAVSVRVGVGLVHWGGWGVWLTRGEGCGKMHMLWAVLNIQILDLCNKIQLN